MVWGVNQDTSVTEPTLREPNLRRDLPMARESRRCRDLRSLREPPLVRALAMGREPGVWAGPAQIA